MSVENLKAKVIQKAWEDNSFKEQLLSNPKVALKATFGIVIPEDVNIMTLEEIENQFVLVIPANPAKVLVTSNGARAQW